MQLHNTVLALQIMNGVKVYAVKFMNDGRDKSVADDDLDAPTFRPAYSTKVYHYKSDKTLEPGAHVIVPTNDGRRFGIAKVYADATDEIDYDSPVRLLWINQEIESPFDVFEVHAAHDAAARRKLAASQAKKAAEDHLKTLGVDLSAFAIEDKTNAQD